MLVYRHAVKQFNIPTNCSISNSLTNNHDEPESNIANISGELQKNTRHAAALRISFSSLISKKKLTKNRNATDLQDLFLTLLKNSKEEKLTKRSGGAIGLEYNRRRGDCEKGVAPRDTSLTN